MGLVAVTVAFTALGAYIGRDLSGVAGLLLFIGAFGCIIGLNVAAARGMEQLAIVLLFGLGLLLGLAVAPLIADYAARTRLPLQAGGADRAVRCRPRGVRLRDAPRPVVLGAHLFWALLALIAFGIVAIFVSIPNANIIYSVAGIVIFGAYTIFDFNRLRRANPDAAVPIAAGIFLDVFNIFLFALNSSAGTTAELSFALVGAAQLSMNSSPRPRSLDAGRLSPGNRGSRTSRSKARTSSGQRWPALLAAGRTGSRGPAPLPVPRHADRVGALVERSNSSTGSCQQVFSMSSVSDFTSSWSS